MARLSRVWHALGPEQRIAATAAPALLVTMLLPWYQQNAVVTAEHAAPLQSRNLDAFQVFSFVEAAVLLVALAIGYLLFARAEGHDFRLPASDGTMVFLAGMWSLALLVLRLFDKPGISGRGVAGNVGVQWGIFFALAAAGALAYAGSRMRSAELHAEQHHRHPRRGVGRSERPRAAGEEPEPLTPAVVGAPSGRRAHASRPAPPSRPAPASRPVAPAGPVPASRPATAAGAELRPAPALAERPGSNVGAEVPTAVVPGERPPRPRYPPAPSRQMSFEDPPRED